MVVICTAGFAPPGVAQTQSDSAAATAAGDAAGYYVYNDDELGRVDLALLPAHQFVLVIRPPGAAASGATGWYLLRDDGSLSLSGDGWDASGSLRGKVLRLVFDDLSPLAAVAGERLPLERIGPAVSPREPAGQRSAAARVRDAAPPELPITPWLWVVAAVPLVVLIVLLAVMHWEPAPAAAVALAFAVVVAFAIYQLPLHTMAVATGKALWDAFFVMYIVWPALVLYSVIKEAGAFERIEKAMEQLVQSRLLMIFAIAWTFSSFIQGIVGEGVPLAITIPLMLHLGVRPVYAVVLPLIGRTWGNVFGSMGEGWLIVLRATEIPAPLQTALYTAVLLIIPNLLAGVGIAWIYGRWWAIKRGAFAILAITAAHSGIQLALAAFYPRIAGFAAASVGLLVVFALAKWGPYTRADEQTPGTIFKEGKTPDLEDTGSEVTRDARMSLPLAFAPYAILAVLAVAFLVVGPIRGFLEQFAVGFAFPAISTPLGIERPAETSYEAFKILIHPGTLIAITTVLAFWLYRRNGFFGRHAPGRILNRALHESLPATTPFVALVLMAKVMELSGMMLVLGLGIALVTTPALYSALSPGVGALGAFATSSTSGSLVLFTPLQATVAQALDIPISVTVAGQMAGAAAGNALAALDILIGLLVIGLPQLLGRVLKVTAVWTLLVLVLIGAGTCGLYLVS